MGFNRSEIVKITAEKFNTTQRNVYYHWKSVSKFQAKIMASEESFYAALNRYEHMYREFAFQYLQAKGNEKVGYGRLMMETQDRIRALTVSPDQLRPEQKDIELSFADTELDSTEDLLKQSLIENVVNKDYETKTNETEEDKEQAEETSK
jgi:hypothetical protein